MLWDSHMHTDFSGDSSASPESMAEGSIKKGLAGICITDHLDIDYPQHPELFNLSLPDYIPSIQSLRERFLGKCDIRLGIELGLQPHLAERHQELIAASPFDFVIGSSHVVHGSDPYYPEYYQGRTEAEAYREYFESILENIHAYDEFDVYGHMDYVVRYGPGKDSDYSYEKYKDIIDEILITLIQKGKGIELNTGGLKYGLKHPNPTESILKFYRELGGEIITVGADSHAPEHIAYGFRLVPDILASCGFRYYTVFRERKPEFLKL